jgi:hypothetical protein
MNTKHTPGEWTAIKHKTGIFIETKTGDMICELLYDAPINETEANAALIAQSPAMLKTLQYLKDALEVEEVSIDFMKGCLPLIEATINKATAKEAQG